MTMPDDSATHLQCETKMKQSEGLELQNVQLSTRNEVRLHGMWELEKLTTIQKYKKDKMLVEWNKNWVCSVRPKVIADTY